MGPHDGYWACFDAFYEGDFREAAKGFREAAKDGIVNMDPFIGGPWIDSICFHAMIGECYYQMGDMTNALDQHSAAVKLFLNYRDWMLRAEFTSIEPEANSKNPVTWGISQRRTTLGHFPEKFQLLQGKSMAENAQAATVGGVIAPQELWNTYVSEIVRCTSLSISRRGEILGPASQYDPLTQQTVDALARRPGPPNHWSQCWVSLQLGCAYAAAGNVAQANTALPNPAY